MSMGLRYRRRNCATKRRNKHIYPLRRRTAVSERHYTVLTCNKQQFKPSFVDFYSLSDAEQVYCNLNAPRKAALLILDTAFLNTERAGLGRGVFGRAESCHTTPSSPWFASPRINNVKCYVKDKKGENYQHLRSSQSAPTAYTLLRIIQVNYPKMQDSKRRN